jgi:sporulation protein YlmC with PRC-barrel domain
MVPIVAAEVLSSGSRPATVARLGCQSVTFGPTAALPFDDNVHYNAREAAIMSTTTVFTIGTKVTCNDGECGNLTRVILDPVAQAVTHLVVEPAHDKAAGHLVPIDLVESATDTIKLQCALSDFNAFESAEETRFLPGPTGHSDYKAEHALVWPYYGITMGAGLGNGLGTDVGRRDQTITYERVPMGEVSIHRGEHVHATDGNIGRVQGLIIDPSDHHVTHVLLDEGHLWGKQQVAIPIKTVIHVSNIVDVNLTKDDIRKLPAVAIDDPGKA